MRCEIWGKGCWLRSLPGFVDLAGLAATDGDDDFQLVGIRQDDFPMLASGHDFAIAFDSNAFAGKIKFVNKF